MQRRNPSEKLHLSRENVVLSCFFFLSTPTIRWGYPEAGHGKEMWRFSHNGCVTVTSKSSSSSTDRMEGKSYSAGYVCNTSMRDTQRANLNQLTRIIETCLNSHVTYVRTVKMLEIRRNGCGDDLKTWFIKFKTGI